jgi:hypothetical protein
LKSVEKGLSCYYGRGQAFVAQASFNGGADRFPKVI